MKATARRSGVGLAQIMLLSFLAFLPIATKAQLSITGYASITGGRVNLTQSGFFHYVNLQATRYQSGTAVVCVGRVYIVCPSGPLAMIMNAQMSKLEFPADTQGHTDRVLLTTAPYNHTDLSNWVAGDGTTIVNFKAYAVIEITTDNGRLGPGIPVYGEQAQIGLMIYDLGADPINPPLRLQTTLTGTNSPGDPYGLYALYTGATWLRP